MPSTFGTDAGKTALEASYERLLATAEGLSHMSPSMRERLDGEAIMHLAAMPLWKRAGVVLLHPTEPGGVSMRRVAELALKGGKRLGVAVLAGEPGEESTAEQTVDFIEVHSADEVDEPPAGHAALAATRAEGDTMGFTAHELLESLCLVPGLVFDAQGHRVQRDGDAYDRFLRFYPGHKLALVHSLQVSSNPLPVEAGEIALDYVVSDGAVWRCRRLGC